MPRREQPLESGDDVLLGFAAALRELREKAGSPTYRQLSGRAHYSAAALSEAASGRKLPSLQVTIAYVGACGGDTELWTTRWHEIAGGRNGHKTADDGGEEEPPYVGLAAFQENDAARFFGRESLIDDLVCRVREHRFFGVFGASGSGKSSILRAGLATRFPSSKIVICTPGPHPIEEFAVRLAGVLEESPAVLRDEFTADPANLHLRIRQADAELLLIVDQFEELFTLCQDEGERRWLIEALTTAALAETSRARVVIGVRADFYGHCGQYPELVRAIRDAQLLVGPMTADELRRAVTEPAARAGSRVETALVTRLVSDAAGRPGVLPMVSHALLETWRRRRGTTLTLVGYESVGGIQHALSRTAEDIYGSLDPGQRDVAKRIFLRLTALGDGTEDTKRRIRRDELDGDPGTAVVLDRLAAARLVTLDRDTVELTHEALIRHWPRLAGWLAEDREGQRIHHELADATNAWEALHRDPGALYRGARLARASDWAGGRAAGLTAREREFLDTSLAAEARERNLTRRRRRRSRQFVALLAVLLLIAGAATGYAIRNQQTAEQQRNAALALSALREASLMRINNPALAMQLTLAAYRLDPTLTARDALHETLATPYAARLTGHTDAVYGVAISGDGTLAATATPDTRTQVKLFDLSDRRNPRELASLPTSASSVAFSPRAKIVATAGSGAQPRLWDVADPRNPRELTRERVDGGPNPGPGSAIAFHPNGRYLATTGSDLTTRLWDVSDPRDIRALATVDDTTGGSSVAFSGDGRTLVATTHDQRVRLWDLSDPNAPAQLGELGGEDRVVAVTISPNGRVLATAGAACCRLWDLSDRHHPVALAPLTGHTSTGLAVAFSADGRMVATGNADRTTRVWDVSDPATPVELAAFRGHTDAVQAVTFGPDGRTLATASADRTARLEDISELALAGHVPFAYAVELSPDGRLMAVASGEKSVRLWDITDRERPTTIATLHPDDTAVSLKFSPDSRFLATAGARGVVQRWDLRAPLPAEPVPAPAVLAFTFRSDGGMIALTHGPTRLWSAGLADVNTVAYQAAFGSGGRAMATATSEGLTQLWDIADPGHPRLAATLPSNGFPMAYSGDGRLLAVADRDGATRLWDVSDLNQPRALSTIPTGTRRFTIPGPGVKVAFSLDGRRVVTAGGDQTARLWDISDPRHPKEEATLRGHAADVLAVAFSSDGHTIATAGNDHSVRLWETDVERLAGRVCEIAHPRINKAEWDQYFRGIGYNPPCR